MGIPQKNCRSAFAALLSPFEASGLTRELAANTLHETPLGVGLGLLQGKFRVAIRRVLGSYNVGLELLQGRLTVAT